MQVMQEGQTIKHEMYGLGIVTASDQERTAVDFDDHGAKLFVTSIMTAELIGEAPATPPKTKRLIFQNPSLSSRLSREMHTDAALRRILAQRCLVWFIET